MLTFILFFDLTLISLNKINFMDYDKNPYKTKKRKVRQNDDSEVPLLIKTVFPPIKKDSSNLRIDPTYVI